MANNPASRVSEPLTAKVSRAEIDVGLRRYLLSVYNYMASGLALTGVVAYAAAETGFYASLVKTPLLFWGVALAPLALVFLLSFRIDKMSLGAAQAAFLAYAGLSLAGIFLVYTGTSIARTFFITGAQDPSLAKTLPRKSSRLFQIQFGSKLGQALQRTKRRTRGILAA
jgi:FtsH-binding integral membrane protein